MRKPEDIIGELLLQNSCVIIPNFGGFIAQPVPSKIDYESGKMFPPSKSILFNKQLINNDGLLANEFAKANNINFDEATDAIHQMVESWNKTLEQGGRIELDKVGILFFDEEKNICFEQDRFFNLLLASFGLSQVNFLPKEDVEVVQKTIEFATTKESIKEVENINIEKRTQEPITIEHPEAVKKEKKTAVWKYVAAACFLPIAFYTFWIPLKTDVLESGVLSIKDFNPFRRIEAKYSPPKSFPVFEVKKETKRTLEEQLEVLPKDVETYSYEYSPELYFNVTLPVTNKERNKGSKLEEASVDKEVLAVNPDAMNLILGCFSVKENAENLVKKLREHGFSARILGKAKGLYRVSAGEAFSLEEINKLRKQAEILGYKGWILK